MVVEEVTGKCWDKTIFTTTILFLQTAAKHRALLNAVLLEGSSLAPNELSHYCQQLSVAQLLMGDLPYG